MTISNYDRSNLTGKSLCRQLIALTNKGGGGGRGVRKVEEKGEGGKRERMAKGVSI